LPKRHAQMMSVDKLFSFKFQGGQRQTPENGGIVEFQKPSEKDNSRFF